MAKVCNKDRNGNPVDLETMLKRFKRQVDNEGIIFECNRRRYHLSKKESQKLKRERLRMLTRKGN